MEDKLILVRGATMSNGGKSIIALPSTTADEKISRIVFTFEEGVPVTTSRMMLTI